MSPLTHAYGVVFFRAWLIVMFTAMNVTFISRANWVMMFLTGFAISFTWWWNSRTAAHSELPYGGWLYGVGAATGTVMGAWIARLI